MPTTRPQSERSATYQTMDYHIGLVKSSYTGWSGLVYQTNISSYPTLCMAMRTWPKISIMIIALFQTESVASRIWLADSVTEGSEVSDWSISIWIWTVFCLWSFLILVHCSNLYQITFILPDLKGPSKSHDSYSVGMTHMIWLIWFILSPSLTKIGNHDACIYSFIAYFSLDIYGVFEVNLKYLHVFEQECSCTRLYPNLNGNRSRFFSSFLRQKFCLF